MLGVVGVKNGEIIWNTKEGGLTMKAGDVVKSISNTYKLNGWNHFDAFAGSRVVSDEVEFYIGLPVVVAGDATGVPIEKIAIALRGEL
jgi:hypothetical protein